jgi:hypothetical protein
MSSVNEINKIFISHSTIDRGYAECLVRLLTDMGVSDEAIFCSSVQGYGIPLGENFLTYLKDTLNENILALFILSENFYLSKICLCEMGAAWVRTSKHIPIIVPPFKFEDIKGVIVGSQGMEINNREAVNQLKYDISGIFNLKSINENIWERRREEYLKKIKDLIEKQNLKPSIIPEPGKQNNEIDYRKTLFKLLKSTNRLMKTSEIYEQLILHYSIDKKGTDIFDIFDVLKALEAEGMIKGVAFDGVSLEEIPWRAVI